MSSRRSGRALRLALVCLAMLFLGAVTAQAAEPTSEAAVQPAPEPLEAELPPAKDWLSTAMNAGAIGFCLWMLALLWRPGLGRSLRRPGPGDSPPTR